MLWEFGRKRKILGRCRGCCPLCCDEKRTRYHQNVVTPWRDCGRCLFEAAVAEPEHTVAAFGEFAVVRNDDRGEFALAAQALQQREECRSGVIVEVAGGLVGEEDSWRRDEGASYGDSLLFAPGEFAGAVVRARGEFDACEPGVGFGERLRVGDATSEEGKGDVFDRAELGKKVVELPDEAEGAVAEAGGLLGAEAGYVGAVDPDLPGGGCVQAGEQMQEGALAGAALTDDGDGLAAGDLQVEIAKE